MERRNKQIMFSIVLMSLVFIVSCQQQVDEEKASKLANCLADKNVKEYGAFWCPNCAQQEKNFGKSFQILKDKRVYVECDPRCETDDLPIACRGIKGQPELCLQKSVDKYPTWEFPDGTIEVRVFELDELAQRSGCGL